MKLFEINEEIYKCVDEETGEIIDMEKLVDLQLKFDEKVEGLACWYKELVAEAKAVQEVKEKISARQKALENKAESLKNYLDSVLNGQKFKTSKVVISYRTSTTTEVSDWREVPEEFLSTKDPEPDKTAIKKALKEGIKVPGCLLVDHRNICIK